MPGPRRRNKISQQFVPHTVEMIESPAWRCLSLSGRRVLDRIEIEHAHHGGQENGKLPVTYEDFMAYPMDRHCIAPAIREAAALGFLEVTEQGRAGNAEFRKPNKFRLTYLHDPSRLAPSDEWRQFHTIQDAKAAANAARLSVVTRRSKRDRLLAA